jgi:hypothetical protein
LRRSAPTHIRRFEKRDFRARRGPQIAARIYAARQISSLLAGVAARRFSDPHGASGRSEHRVKFARRNGLAKTINPARRNWSPMILRRAPANPNRTRAQSMPGRAHAHKAAPWARKFAARARSINSTFIRNALIQHDKIPATAFCARAFWLCMRAQARPETRVTDPRIGPGRRRNRCRHDPADACRSTRR